MASDPQTTTASPPLKQRGSAHPTTTLPKKHVDAPGSLIRLSRKTPKSPVFASSPSRLAPLGGSLGTGSTFGDLLARAKRSLGGWSFPVFPTNKRPGSSHVCAFVYLSRCMEFAYTSAKASARIPIATDSHTGPACLLPRQRDKRKNCFARLDCTTLIVPRACRACLVRDYLN